MKKTEKRIHNNSILNIDLKTVFLFCIYIHFPAIEALPFLSYSIEYGVPIIYIIKNRKRFKNLAPKTVRLLSLVLLLIALSIITPLIHQTYDFTYVMTTTYIVRKLIIYTFLILWLSGRKKGKKGAKEFLYYFALSNAIYVIGTMILALLPEFKNMWFSVFKMANGSEQLLQSYGYTFRIGWTGFSGYRSTIQCAFSCIFVMYLFFSKDSPIDRKLFYPTYSLCLLGTMFYGRSGLVIAIAASITLLVAMNLHRKKMFAEFTIALAAIAGLIFALRELPIVHDWYIWATQPLTNLVTKGNFDNYSFSHTQQMIYMPEAKTILFGDGLYVQDGHYYKKTDSGIMRNTLFWGILGVMLSYGTTIYSIADARKANKALFCTIVAAIILFEYKGEVYYEVIPFAIALSLIGSLKAATPNRTISP